MRFSSEFLKYFAGQILSLMREICVMAQYENKKVMLKPDEQMLIYI